MLPHTLVAGVDIEPATDKGFVTGGCAEWVGPASSPE